MNSNLNLQNIQMFCRVVEEESFSKAAKICYVSQPAVTKQIQLLEESFGMALIDRDQGAIYLTDAGRVLYKYSKEIIAMCKQTEKAVKQTISSYQTTIDIGASFTIGEYLLPGILGSFQNENADIRFGLLIGNTPSVIAKLEKNEIDVAFVEGIIEKKGFYQEKITEDDLIVVTPRGHKWNVKGEITIEDLAKEKIIWREKNAGARKIIENFLQEYDILDKISSRMELGSTQAIKSAVEADLGIAILPRLSVIRELEQGVLNEINIPVLEMKRELWMVKKISRFSNENLEKLIEYVRTHMRILLTII